MKGKRDTFDTLHAGLAVDLIHTPRADLVTCHPEELVTNVLRRNRLRAESYDYLPVDREGEIIGLFPAKRLLSDPPSREARVESLMQGSSGGDLIAAGASILDFFLGIQRNPYRLVVAETAVVGFVTWSDLQKLPVRVALFGLITGLEIEMLRAIRSHLPKGDAWLEYLPKDRKGYIQKTIEKSVEGDGVVDSLLHTNLRDKAQILRRIADASPWAGTEEESERIVKLRNAVAHAKDYAMSLPEAEAVRRTIVSMMKRRTALREHRRSERRG